MLIRCDASLKVNATLSDRTQLEHNSIIDALYHEVFRFKAFPQPPVYISVLMLNCCVNIKSVKFRLK